MNGFHLTGEGKTHADCETDLNENYSALSFFGEIYLKVYINQRVWQALLGEGKEKSDARGIAWSRAQRAREGLRSPCFSRMRARAIWPIPTAPKEKPKK